jgi:exonuclease VII small subunit
MMEPQAVTSSPRSESEQEMADLGAIVAQLKAERAKLDKAIEALSGVAGKSGGGTRKLSAAARARIAAAQRARWAKFKAKKAK